MELKGQELEISVSQKEFEDLILPMIDKTITTTEILIKNAGLKIGLIDHAMVLTEQWSTLEFTKLKELLTFEPLMYNADAAALGTAYYAANFNGQTPADEGRIVVENLK